MAKEPDKGGLLKTLQSVLAAMFGVQSERRRREDFSSEKPWRFILAGLIVAAAFVIFVMLLVRWALSLGAA
ncbi:hypothetical protein GCM10011348_43150 [Marinobacterium nitratireducens]|uniref:DUF2970 domain-containing protein n=1 Tax=Marinobacterium nitratireducens TaxID=518897 RepID=A0A917ZPQ2_9GAMM|nr:DUF2970 domain-containing protein [Marinobacterium nitratireducens]GGO88200.1 hypothetical protein GCM10011348_43150 [Marinobacterium nitratireducens]